MRISDWSSDLCSSDLQRKEGAERRSEEAGRVRFAVIEKRHAPAKQTWSRRRRRDHRPHHPQTRRGCPAMVPPLELGPSRRPAPASLRNAVHRNQYALPVGNRRGRGEIGRASGRERGCQDVEISVVASSLKKKKKQ